MVGNQKDVIEERKYQNRNTFVESQFNADFL